MLDHIEVSYEAIIEERLIKEFLDYIVSQPLAAFDTETRSIYTPEERKEAVELLKENPNTSYRELAHVVSNSSGLSYPEITKVTHFVFSESEERSTLIVLDDPKLEVDVWKKVSKFNGLLAVHNSLFDLKIMYQRIKKLPDNFTDTQLMAKTLVNHVNIWKAKTGLKDLMGSYYDPVWSLMEDYEPKDLLDSKFLQYAAIDGAATFKLYGMLKEMYEDL